MNFPPFPKVIDVWFGSTGVEYFPREFLGEQKIEIASLSPFLVDRWR